MFKIISFAFISLLAVGISLQAISSVRPTGPVQKGDAELVNLERNISIINNKLYKTEKVEIKINNRDGEKYTNISIPYSKMVRISDIDAYILDNSGTRIKTLKKNEITDKSKISDYSFYEDVYVKEFTLKHNIFPYTFCYSYKEQQDEFLHIDYWLPVLARRVPTQKAVLTLTIPSDYKISYTSQDIASFSADTSGPIKKYTWEACYNNIIPYELYSPVFSSLVPSVNIIPIQFKYDVRGSQKTWTDLGNYIWNLRNNLSDLSSEEKIKILSVISGTEDTSEKVKKLYHYVQDAVRYVNISINTGGLKPYPASYVAQNKYGDCKALTNYFMSVLEAAGIKSYYSLILADDPIDPVLKSFPSQQFNHVITCITVKSDTLWCDCTNKLAFNYNGTFIQNRDVLVIDENNTHFSRIPALSADKVTESRKINLSSNAAGTVSCSIKYIFRGENYEAFADLLHNYNESDKSRIVHNTLAEVGFEVVDYKIYNPGRDSKEIILSCTGKFNKLYRRYGNDQLINLPPVGIPSFEEPSIRKLPVQIDFPIQKVDTIDITLPDGFSFSSMPDDKAVLSRFGSYFCEFKHSGEKVFVIRKFLLNSGNYPIEDYGDLYSFIKGITESEKTSVIVTSKKI
jgi:hypothetical protein